MQPAPKEDEGAALSRRDTCNPSTDAKLLTETDATRFVSQEGIGTGLDHEAIEALRIDLAAKSVTRLEQRHSGLGR